MDQANHFNHTGYVTFAYLRGERELNSYAEKSTRTKHHALE